MAARVFHMETLRRRLYIHAADRVTTGDEMSIWSNIGKRREARHRDAGLYFVVGQDETGRWVVVESRDHGGGILVDRQAALNYAASEAGRRADAARCSTEPPALWRQFDAAASSAFGARG